MPSDSIMTSLQRHNTENSKQLFTPKRNCAASVPISTLMNVTVSELYSLTIGLPVLLQENMWIDPENINRSQTHECENWDWGPDIPFLGIFVSNFRHFAFAVYSLSSHSCSCSNRSCLMSNISCSLQDTSVLRQASPTRCRWELSLYLKRFMIGEPIFYIFLC